MPVGARRSRTHFGLSTRRPVQRYTWWRWGIGCVGTLGIALLPATDTLRIDLWAGNHRWLGEPVGLVEAAKAFAFPFLGLNVAIVLVTRFLGRWLCGFACPIGSLSRLAEWFQWRQRRTWRRVLGQATVLALCLTLAAIIFGFWVDWRVFRDGSPRASALSAGFLLALGAGLFGIVQGLGLRFCRDLCPSGVYFALLGTDSLSGVAFAHPEQCTDCRACESVCPVDLQPRAMASAVQRSGRGFYPDGLTNLANCLRCGDCVAACESTTARDDAPTPLRLGWLAPASSKSSPAGPQRSPAAPQHSDREPS